jgi:hypothetical protein
MKLHHVQTTTSKAKQQGSAIIYVVLAIIIISAAAGVLFFKAKQPPKLAHEMEMSQVAPAVSALPEVTVYKSATCGCCSKWITHLENEGFKVVSHNKDDMNAIKMEAGLQPGLASCHTAFVDGYVIEGHVPASDIKRLLTEKPAVLGLTAPGMPQKSPGMQPEGLAAQGYDVLAFDKAGQTSVFKRY